MRWYNRVLVRKILVFGAFFLLLSLTLGCSGGKGKVNGKVTLDGQPLPAGTISFIPSNGSAVGAEIKDGQYAVERVPVGDVKVTVETASVKEKLNAISVAAQHSRMMQARPGASMPEEAKTALEEERRQSQAALQKQKDLQAAYRYIPEKYSKVESSGLSLQVKSGDNPFDVALTSK